MHRKWRKLRLRNPAMCAALIELWCALGATDSVDGRIGDEDDVAAMAGGSDTAATLHAAGFLDERGGIYYAHDWCDHQRWVATAGERKEHARRLSDMRWGLRRGSAQASGTDTATDTATESLPESSVSVSVSASVPVTNKKAAPRVKKPQPDEHDEPGSDFESLRGMYPGRRGSMIEARRQWAKVPPIMKRHAMDRLAVLREAQERVEAAGQWTPQWPHLERWIKHARWNDEPVKLEGKALKASRQAAIGKRTEAHDPGPWWNWWNSIKAKHDRTAAGIKAAAVAALNIRDTGKAPTDVMADKAQCWDLVEEYAKGGA